MTQKFLSQAELATLVTELVAAKTRVIAPVRAKIIPNSSTTCLSRSWKRRHSARRCHAVP